MEATDQENVGGGHTKTARGPASKPSANSASGFARSFRGPPGVFSLSDWCGLAQDLFLRVVPDSEMVETRRLELLTLSLQRRCSAN